ncbi:alpha-D-ribose 1-methylphosphonate 5-triphosphate diphosphatase [Cohnella sp. CIP 111063]|uniref:alpha-D-ribose 1-methylphosphonate 5-triphosphate diphosphatase n=1 Tax=unclassified Cohnella TaxID=2636738 RepID=UPI000B8C08C2|nr:MULTISPECIES: alpha-D-ribose 1-methylphosphonate 5-triphosphate diphosphatase [unclassified Cohnella]OXS53996.1 alpha-D-ribose 1-methylphosphonate 5-triphosphate diphosphatase [Cohnella sp. CIP 111063]PRX62869.1 alpha-D-ribose 1-methylphosphonate 5-triphosphate diphosphatase [Cohnella sp. SGD-V74]
MGKRLAIRGGLVVRPDGVSQGDLTIEDGIIAAIDGAGSAGDSADIDAEGCWVLPGLIDLHCDAIEKEVEPRPNTLFPMEMAFLQFERKLAGHGITTMLHSLSLGVGLSLRGEHLVGEMIELIAAMRKERAMIRHGVHLRYEVSHLTGFELARRLLSEGLLDYLSLMDHAPGQGQYHRPGAFERYVMKNQGVGVDEVAAIVEELQERRSRVDWSKLKALTAQARTAGIAVASHDDDTAEAVERSLGFGATVSEFPLNLDTARFASARGMGVCVGAPNIVRGGSHDGNLKASEAVREGVADILCSDYHPASLLHAIFCLESEGVPLHHAVNMATLNPAAALGRDDTLGSLKIGKRADVIVVGKIRGIPVVRCTIVDGTVVHETRDIG